VPAAKATIELQAQAIFGHDTSGRLSEISTPTLIVHGTEDGVLPFPNGELIASLMPAARFEVLDGVGHMFWWEQPQRSAELIREHALAAA
jgi:pimeloyl-ACP methyl ester carboxylesterase